MRIELKQFIPRLSRYERWLYLTEVFFWVLFGILCVLFSTGGVEFSWWGVTFRLHSLDHPLIYFFLFFILHILLAREKAFPLALGLIRGSEKLLGQIHRPLKKVHWALKLSLLLAIAWVTFGPLRHRPIAGPTRVMVSDKAQTESLRYETQDSNIDFHPPDLRREFFKADRIEILWSGFLFVPEEGTYRVAVEADGLYRFKIMGREILKAEPDWYIQRTEKEIFLPYGVHSFELSYGDIGFQSTVRLLWKPPRGKWEPIPGHCLSRDRASYNEYRSLERRNRFQPVFFLLLLFWIWHFLTLSIEKWVSASEQQQQKHYSRILLVIFLLGAFALRMQFLIRTHAMTHADEAIVGLMARHIAQGLNFPIIYYDQVYNGTLLAYVLAPFYLLFDFPLWNLKLATCLMSVLLVYLVYRVGRQWFGEEVGLIAAGLMSLAPVMGVIYGLMALVGPIEGVVVAFVILEIATPILFSKKSSSGVRYFLLGLFCGLGVWLNFQLFYYLLPLGLFLLFRGYRTFRRLPQLVLGGLIGMAPLLVYNFTHQFVTFQRFIAGGETEEEGLKILQHHLIGVGIPHLLGSRVRWDLYRSFTPEPLPKMIGIGFGLALLTLLVSQIYRLLKVPDEKKSQHRPAAFLFLFFISVLFFYLRSGFGEYHPRYLFSTLPMVALLWGWWTTRRLHSSAALTALLILPLILQNAIGNWKVDPFYFSQPVHYVERGFFLPTRNDELIEFLEQQNLTHLHSDYWIAYALALESSEKIQCDSDRDRHLPYREAFQESSRPAYLFHNHDPQIDLYRYVFGTQLVYEMKEILPYVVYYPERDLLPRKNWSATAGQNSDSAFLSVDGDISFFSHWQTLIESGEAWLEIDLGSLQEIEQVLLFRGVDPTGGDTSQTGLIQGQLLLSQDGQDWRPVAASERGYFGYHDRFQFSKQKARYLKIINRPDQFPYLWNVFDVFVQ